MSFPERGAESEENRAGLFRKLRIDVEAAMKQLAAQAKCQKAVLFLALNLSSDISFFWHDQFCERIGELKQEYLSRGLDILIEEVGYL
jgi:hypothetical protein